MKTSRTECGPLALAMRLLVRWPKPGMVSPLWALQNLTTELNESPQSLVNGTFPRSTDEGTKTRRCNDH